MSDKCCKLSWELAGFRKSSLSLCFACDCYAEQSGVKMGWRITAGKCLGNCLCLWAGWGGSSDRERDEGGEEEKQKTYKLLPSWKILSSSSTRVSSLIILHNIYV